MSDLSLAEARDILISRPLPDKNLDYAFNQTSGSHTSEWYEWRMQMMQLAPVPGSVYDLSPGISYGDYAGTLVVNMSTRDSGLSIVYLEAEDEGWDPTEVGELDDDGNVVREARGVNIINTTVFVLSSAGLLAPEKLNEVYEEGTVPGPVAAILSAKDMKEAFPNGFYWEYATSWMHDRVTGPYATIKGF